VNILFSHRAEIHSKSGGIERVSSILAGYFQSRGHNVFYLARKRDFPDEDFAGQFFMPRGKKKNHPENGIFVEKLIKEKHIDIVIDQRVGFEKFVMADVFRRNNVPVVGVLHIDPLNFAQVIISKLDIFKRKTGFWKMLYWLFFIYSKINKFRKKIRQKEIYGYNFANADAVVLLSEKHREKFASFLPKTASLDKIKIIPNPLTCAPEPVDFAEKQKSILYVGRMSRVGKRLDLLFEIWARLQEKFPDWSLYLVGLGGDFHELKNSARKLNLKRIYFEGNQNPVSYYRKSSLFCLTSASEGWGLVLMESAAFGCVPVAFKSFEAAEDLIRDGEDGILIRPFETEAYSDALEKLMRDAALRAKMGGTAQKRARQFSIEHVGAEWLALFDEIFQRRNKDERLGQ
jgi:glycosyltransferase involved in cell wall biosynthesis